MFHKCSYLDLQDTVAKMQQTQTLKFDCCTNTYPLTTHKVNQLTLYWEDFLVCLRFSGMSQIFITVCVMKTNMLQFFCHISLSTLNSYCVFFSHKSFIKLKIKQNLLNLNLSNFPLFFLIWIESFQFLWQRRSPQPKCHFSPVFNNANSPASGGSHPHFKVFTRVSKQLLFHLHSCLTKDINE